MKNKCIICDEEFNSKELLKKHVDAHLNKSILSKSIETSEVDITIHTNNNAVDLKKIFSGEKFEKLVQPKINCIEDINELIKRRNFVEQIKDIITKNPFVYVQYFVKDFMDGELSKDLLKKYHILNHIELKYIVKDILKFTNDRYRLQSYPNALELNFKIHGWSEKCDIINENCEFFKNEILELFFYNIIRAYIILFMMDHTKSGIDKELIISKCRSIKNNYDLFHFPDKKLAESFDKFFDSNFPNSVLEILYELIDEKIIEREKGNLKLLVGTLSIDKIKKDSINELKINSGKLIQGPLRASVMLQNPGLKLVPGFGVWYTALRELENEHQIHIDFVNRFDRSNLIYLKEDYQIIEQKLTSLNKNTLKFYGRRISPETFIFELLELKQGDFEDDDDQVTRLAGLVLAESINLLSPHESISEFDFSVNIKNYDFRPEQREAMSKADFKIISEIIHFKAMIKETLTLEKYEELKKKLPQNEQGAVFTFKRIPNNLQQILANDKSIQIIDEEGVRLWASITSRIPARKNSIAKLHYDQISKLEDKIVRINSINYENSLATVSILPDMKEATVLVGKLEEIPLYENYIGEYEIKNNNYFDFLKKLYNCSPVNFEKGLCKTKIIEANESTITSSYDGKPNKTNHWSVQLENITVDINLREMTYGKIFNCQCLHRENQEYSYTFCKHVVAALNIIGLKGNYFDKSWGSNRNKLYSALKIFVETSAESSIYELSNNLNEDAKNLLVNYLEAYLEISNN